MAVLAADNRTLGNFDEDGDLFSTAVPELMILLALLPFLALALGLVLYFWVAGQSVPAWNAYSVPPPRLY